MKGNDYSPLSSMSKPFYLYIAVLLSSAGMCYRYIIFCLSVHFRFWILRHCINMRRHFRFAFDFNGTLSNGIIGNRHYYSEQTDVSNYLALPFLGFWTYLMRVIPEARCAHYIWYLRFYLDKSYKVMTLRVNLLLASKTGYHFCPNSVCTL
jgi:hypothetical protein